MDDEDRNAQKRGRPFTKGQSGNPSGRPKGAQNRSTRQARELLAEKTELVIRKLFDDVERGDGVAIRFCASRLIPIPREEPVELEIGELRNAADVKAAYASAGKALEDGNITSTQIEKVHNFLKGSLEAHRAEKRERRLNIDQTLNELFGTPEKFKSRSNKTGSQMQQSGDE